MNWTRRSILTTAAGTIAATAAPKKKTVAAIVTEYRPLSHADVIVGRLLEGYSPNNERVEPRTQIVSMYTDQIAKQDMSRDLAAKHGFQIYPTVDGALTLGTGELAVDAVLMVGEHGDYPVNPRGQKLYPRFDLFHRILNVFKESERVVPLFTDKHFSYTWDRASAMYKRARLLNVPLMAGSSIPVTVRVPELELPIASQIRHAVAVGYGGLDAYGFHTLEALQCMVERRVGGETGISSVRWLPGDEVWKWRDSPAGSWSAPLLTAALSRGRNKDGRPEENCKQPVAFLLDYRDGFKAAAYMLQGHATGFTFATRPRNNATILSTGFGSPEIRNLAHFDGLVHCIEELFVTGRPVYPVERTLLTTGALAALFDSRETQKKVFTPDLKVTYRAPDKAYFQRK